MAKDGKGAGRAIASDKLGKKTTDNPSGQQIIVQFDLNTFTDDAGFGLDIIHEGSRAADGSEWIQSGFKEARNPSRSSTSTRHI